ncbi:hypothetical protein ACXHPV_17970, partial [Vibrio cincinnatiensis]
MVTTITMVFPAPKTKRFNFCHVLINTFCNLITTNFKLTKESIMAILFTKEEAMKDLPFIEDKAL